MQRHFAQSIRKLLVVTVDGLPRHTLNEFHGLNHGFSIYDILDLLLVQPAMPPSVATQVRAQAVAVKGIVHTLVIFTEWSWLA